MEDRDIKEMQERLEKAKEEIREKLKKENTKKELNKAIKDIKKYTEEPSE